MTLSKFALLATLLFVCVQVSFNKAWAATLTETPANIAQGGTVTATWNAIAAPTNRDWIALYASGAVDTAYLDWIYVSCSKSAGAPFVSGSCPFLIPSSLPNGSYELRLFSNNGYTRLATSNQFAAAPVPPPGTVDLQAAVQALQVAVQALQAQNATLTAQVAALDSANIALRNEVTTYLRPLEPYLTVDTSTLNGLPGPHIIFTGANVHIQNGKGPLQGFTAAFGCPANGHCDGSGLLPYLNGVGNLIIGYDEQEPPPYPTQLRTGSHNVVIGYGQEFTGHGGLVGGILNTVTGASTSVTGGFQNVASGIFTSVSGGAGNTATNEATSVSGGVSNTANGLRSSVSGGQNNVASGQSSSISGGRDHSVPGFAASISGGVANISSGDSSSVSGGVGVLSSGVGSWAAGSLRSPNP